MSMIIAARHSLFLCSHSSFSLKYWNSASLTTNNGPSLRKMTTFLLAISHMQQILKLSLFIVSMVTGAVSVFAFLLAISDMQHTKVRERRAKKTVHGLGHAYFKLCICTNICIFEYISLL